MDVTKVIYSTLCEIFNSRLSLGRVSAIRLILKTTFIVKGVDYLKAEVNVCCCVSKKHERMWLVFTDKTSLRFQRNS